MKNPIEIGNNLSFAILAICAVVFLYNVGNCMNRLSEIAAQKVQVQP